MTKHALLGLVAMIALLVLGGCSKDTKSKTAAAVDSGEPVTVLEAGAEPRTPLRYTITDGTVTKSNMDFRLATLAQTADAAALSVVPGVRLHIVSGPSMRTEAGIEFEVNIKKAEAMVPKGIDEELAEDLRQSASILDAVGGTVVISDRGLIQSTKLNEQAKNPDLPLRLLVMIVNARTTLSRVVLPAEPVGLGARWEATKELILCFSGSFLRASSRIFSVGDWIEVAGVRGEVIDHNLFVTTLHNFEADSFNFSGRTTVVPNSVFVGQPMRNDSLMRDYCHHSFSLTLETAVDAYAERDTIEKIVRRRRSSFKQETDQANAATKKRFGIDLASDQVQVAFRTSDLGKYRIEIGFFCPPRLAETLENDITCEVMSYLHGIARRQQLEDAAIRETAGGANSDNGAPGRS